MVKRKCVGLHPHVQQGLGAADESDGVCLGHVYQVRLMAAQTGKGEHAVVFKKSHVSHHTMLVGRIASGIVFNIGVRFFGVYNRWSLEVELRGGFHYDFTRPIAS